MKNIKAILALYLCLMLSLTSLAKAKGKKKVEATEIQADETVLYKSIGKVELNLHLFKPKDHKKSDKRPAIVFFFGGGWMSGTPDQFYQQSKAFAELGFVCFSAEYRVINTHKVTPYDCVKDAKSAIRWVRKNAVELGVDPNRIIAAGGSAGGHLAACTGVIEGFEQDGEDLTISSVPNAMILYNPVLDTTEEGYGSGRFKADRKTEISPCHHVKKGIPPTIIFHGTKDRTVPFENAERFTKLMVEAGNKCILVPFENKDHGFFNGSFFRKANGNDDFNTTMDKSIEFLKELGVTTTEK